ncbi:MAG: hypothetical protein RMJ17_00980 [Candidatus Aenigmarchaeota archaeon]|nr:hypothetical protein [Candidatus Aenigmarchaeota archaeon]MDW8149159.1 hypothetical protein [Candidatus Aenigmarchaeota archaeon]
MNKIIFIIIIFLILLSIFYRPFYFNIAENYEFDSFQNLLFEYEIHRYPAKIEIIKENRSIGISTDINVLDFGKIPLIEGIERVRKFINFTSNDYSKVEIKFYGNISRFLKTSKNNFYLKPFENANVEIIFDLKKVKDYGNYSGEVRIFIIKPKIKWLAEKQFY